MDAKLNQTPLSEVPTQQVVKKKSLFSFIKELKEELKKVSWTAKEELQLSTKIAIGSTFFFGLGIYLVDFVIKGFLDFIAFLARLLLG